MSLGGCSGRFPQLARRDRLRVELLDCFSINRFRGVPEARREHCPKYVYKFRTGS
jgi:hypothetical protein